MRSSKRNTLKLRNTERITEKDSLQRLRLKKKRRDYKRLKTREEPLKNVRDKELRPKD